MNDEEYGDLARDPEGGPAVAYDKWRSETPGADHGRCWETICALMIAAHWQLITPDDHTGITGLYRPDADLGSGDAAVAEWRWAACQWAGSGQANPELLWAVRPLLTHIWTIAKARLVGPWAVAGATMARIIATVPPHVKIQPDRELGGTGIGSWASLNTFVALVGPPGAGKNAGLAVSNESVSIPQGVQAEVEPLGSGEGLAHMFMRRPRASRDDPDPQPEMYRSSVLVTVGEVDAFAAVAGRRGSTLGAQLRAAAMGEQLGFFYVDPTKRMPVADHSYRLCLIAGIQPKRSGALLTGPEAHGGTPQRFIWLPATDRYFSRHRIPRSPDPVEWHPPTWPRGRIGVTVCDPVREEVLRHREAMHAGELSEDDAHAVLLRIKIATTLAIMDGRVAVAEDDWHLSRLVMAMSTTTREQCRQVLAKEAEETNVRLGRAEAARAVIVDDAQEERAMRRVSNAIIRRLSAAGTPVSTGDLRKALSGRDRQHFDDVINRLVAANVITLDTPNTPDGRAGAVCSLVEGGGNRR